MSIEFVEGGDDEPVTLWTCVDGRNCHWPFARCARQSDMESRRLAEWAPGLPGLVLVEISFLFRRATAKSTAG
jgi:hypothetical protein